MFRVLLMIYSIDLEHRTAAELFLNGTGSRNAEFVHGRIHIDERDRMRYAFTPHYDSMSQCSINIIMDRPSELFAFINAQAGVDLSYLYWGYGQSRRICIHA